MTEMTKCLKAYNDNFPFYIGTVVGNTVCHHTAVRNPQDYTFEEYYALWMREELFVDSYYGDAEWDFMDD